ncbi:MAG: energy coupling factor transporter S component ThiW [Oscillospiraceae bacterium]
MKNSKNLRKLTASAFLVALGVVMSTFYIPLGFAKCFPIQHLINVIAGVTLGPAYGVAIAFVISCIRIMMGTGSFLAFPGSMVGALLCGLLYHFFKKIWVAFLGEIIGTGILGAFLAFPIAAYLMGNTSVAFYTYVIPFMASTVIGSAIAVVILTATLKTGVLNKLKIKDKKNEKDNNTQ